MPATPATVLQAWRTILGKRVELGEEDPGRELWPVTAEDGRRYFLKRIGPWRNLPLADEARVQRHLATQGIPVAEFLPTDRASLYAGEPEDSFVLIPRLVSDQLTVTELLPVEKRVGSALAELHLALATYPWPANSYAESLPESLSQQLMLPSDVAESLSQKRDQIIDALTDLPVQLIHGDLTPENVLLQAPGTVSGFIDFDHLPYGPRVWDIGKYLSRRIRRRWTEDSGRSGPVRLEHLPGFLSSYHMVNPLSSAEIEALPSAIAAGNVLEVSYFMEISAGTLPRRQLPDHDDVLADTVEAARWHLAHWDDVVHSVRSSLLPGPETS